MGWGRVTQVQQCIFTLPKCMYVQGASIIVAAGPFTTTDDVSFHPLDELLSLCAGQWLQITLLLFCCKRSRGDIWLHHCIAARDTHCLTPCLDPHYHSALPTQKPARPANFNLSLHSTLQ